MSLFMNLWNHAGKLATGETQVSLREKLKFGTGETQVSPVPPSYAIHHGT
jgi:hypothetical protein